MELRHLRYFLAIAESSSFTRAAVKLRVTQPTLSHQIKQLELEIGSPLFDRVGLRTSLTAQGKVLKTYAEQAINVIESGLTAVAELDGLIHGHLRVGVFHSFGSTLLPTTLAQFIQNYPGVHVVLRQQSRIEMEQGLVNGEIDLAVGYTPADSEKIVEERLFTDPVALVVGKRHPWSARRRISLNELHGQSLVLQTSEHPSRQLIDKYLHSKKIVPRIMAEMNSNEAVLATVRCSTLASLLSARVLAGVPGVRAIRLSEPALSRTAAIFWHRGGYRPAAARKAAEMIRAAYAPSAGS
jgi:LysR family cyn operon transcriptional activator